MLPARSLGRNLWGGAADGAFRPAFGVVEAWVGPPFSTLFLSSLLPNVRRKENHDESPAFLADKLWEDLGDMSRQD